LSSIDPRSLAERECDAVSSLRELIPASFAWWLGGAVLVFWFVGAHNRLVRLRSAALVAYGALDAALSRQVDYVRSRASAALATSAGAAQDAPPASQGAEVTDDARPAPRMDPGALNSLLAAAAQTAAMMASARQKPLEPPGIEALGTALSVLLTAWERLFPGEAVSFDAEGTLSRPVPLLQASNGTVGDESAPPSDSPTLAWPEPSASAEIARAQFNLAVAHYNRAIGQFPAFFIAWAFRLRRAAPLL
jgi:hypothetical protein